MPPPMRDELRTLRALMVAACACATVFAAVASVAQESSGGTAPARLFEEMADVLASPRCLNCHTNTGFPTQGDDRHPHTMNVTRGANDRGAAGLHCDTCHQSANQAASGVPGAPDWHLAPLRMGWEGLSPAVLCHSLFDPAHGGMRPDQLVEHFNTAFVRWAWSPGHDAHGRPRSLPPIDHAAFIDLTRRWVASGAVCPK